MNKDKIISALFKILIVVGAVLSTVIFVNNESNFLWDLIAKNSANLVKIFAILGYSLFLIATIIEIISKNKYLDLLNVIIAVGSIVFLALLKSIYEDSLDVETSVISVGPSIAIVITYMLVVIFLSLRRTSIGVNLNIRDMVEIAMFCAMAIVLDLTFFKIRIGQNGGSISLVMLPLSFLCVRKGFVKGFMEKKGFGVGKSDRNKTFILHSMYQYEVDDTFPKVTEQSFINGVLPSCIVDVSYTVDLSGLTPVNLV